MLGARGLRSPASRRPWCVRFLGGRALHSAVRRGVRMSNAGGDDLYGLLGVDRHASADDLKRAYRCAGCGDGGGGSASAGVVLLVPDSRFADDDYLEDVHSLLSCGEVNGRASAA